MYKDPKKPSGENTTPAVAESDESGIKYDALLNVVMSDYDKARKYVKDNYQEVWEECFKAYNGIRSRHGYEGTADEFAPETFSIVEALKASIAGSKPKFKYVPLREDQEKDTTTLNALVDFYWAQNNMTEKVLNWVGDMIVYGNGILMVSWQGDKPLIQHIPLNDFFVDPAATHMNRPEEPGYPRYAGYRYLTSLQQLKAEMVPDADGNLVGKYKNLDSITAVEGTDDEMDKDRKEKFIGSTYGKDAYKEQIEVVVYFTRRKKIMIANKTTCIYDEENPYSKPETKVPVSGMINGVEFNGEKIIPEIRGFLPFAILRNYVDSNLFFARGDVEVIIPSQEALNDTASQKRDNLAYVLNNMWQIDPRFKHLAEQIESEPGAIFPIPRGALTPIEKQDISASADNEIERQRQQMRTATAADAAVQGVSQKFSRTTATEVQAQLNQASMRFTTKVQNLEDEGFSQLAQILYKMIQIFVDSPTAVRVIGPKGVEWKKYDPTSYIGEYEPRVVLDSTVKAEKAAVAQQMQVAAQFSLGNPLVNQAVFLRRMYEALFPDMPKDDIEEFLATQAPIMGPDGQAVDPNLVQGDAQVTPEAAARLKGEIPTDPKATTDQRRRTQSGNQGGGGADSSSNNIRRTRANQPSTTLDASSRPR